MQTIKSGLIVASGLGLLALPAMTAQGADRELRQLTGFKAISVQGAIDLSVKLGPAYSIEVFASRGDSDQVLTEVRDGTLTIRRQPGPARLFRWFDHYSVSVTLPELEAIVASGGSDINGGGLLSGSRLSVRASGGSDVSLNVQVKELDLQASGGSDMRLRGETTALRIVVSGGSDFLAYELKAVDADIQASGGSDGFLSATGNLTARAAGGSDISYRGNPRTVNVNASGGSEVVRRH